MLTVHTVGGKEMLEAAVQAARSPSQSFGCGTAFDRRCTVLTSTAKDANLEKLVLERARLAKRQA